MFGERKENLTNAFSGIVLASISKHEKEVFRRYLVCSVYVDHFNQVQLLNNWISVWIHEYDFSFEFLTFPII